MNTESTCDWEGEQWTVPINAAVKKLVRFGARTTSIGVGMRYWADGAESSPDGWAYRLEFRLLFPR